MRKIFFVLPNLAAGGAERVTITIARLMKKEGFEVEFINFGEEKGEMVDWIVPEFKMISFNKVRTLTALPKMVKFMKQNLECVFFSSREHVNLISLIASTITNSKVVVRIPNMPKNVLTKGISGMKLKIIKSINQLVLKKASAVIAQNQEMKAQLMEFYNLPDNLVHAINNPVDKDNVLKQAENSISPFDSTAINFVNVCNIAYSKGIDVLLEAWPIVKASIPNAHMYVVGRDTSDYAKSLVDKSKELKDFTFVGFKTNPYPYLKHCNVFVLPSRMEGFPNVVLEAMCFGKPIVATTCVDIIKDLIIPSVNGEYCKIEDSDALAQCMIRAASLEVSQQDYKLFDKQALIDCFL